MAVSRRRQLREAPTTPAQPAATQPKLPANLGEAYHHCAQQAKQRSRVIKDNSLVHLRLNDKRQVFFDKEDRQLIPQELLDEIRDLNWLDVRLYQRSLELLTRNRQQLAESGALQKLPEAPEPPKKCGEGPGDDSSAVDDEDDDDYYDETDGAVE